MGNALKYTKSGSVTIDLSVGEVIRYDEASHEVPVQLTIEDTGIGISKEYLDHDLYTPFSQEDSNSTGTGLGLSIVKQLLGTMGGEITIDSTVGMGTKVCVKVLADFVVDLPSQARGKSDEHMSSVKDLFRDIPFHVSSPVDQRDGGPKHTKSMRSNVVNICCDWFGIQCIPKDHPQDESSPFMRLAANVELDMDASGIKRQKTEQGSPSKGVNKTLSIHLSPSIFARSANTAATELGGEVVVIYQP